MAKVIRLTSENVKRLKAVDITFGDENVVVIGGNNGQGKSSTLDSIEYALGGKPDIDMPIRQGEKKARVVVETEDLVITRTFTASGSKLEVTGKNGDQQYAIKSPQALLDKLVGNRLAFDPLAFSRMDAKKQTETLKELVGIDFSSLDRERASVYEDRTNINRELKSLKSQVEAMPVYNVPKTEVSVSDLTLELQEKMSANNENDAKKRKLEDARNHIRQIEDKAEDIKQKILELQALLEKYNAEVAVETKRIEGLEKVVATLHYHDLGEMRNQINEAENINAKIREARSRNKLEKQIAELEAKSQKCNERISCIDSEKERILAQAKFPVTGLAFDDNALTFNSIPFSQCSSAEQLKISVAMGLAMHPELKLLLIRDGSLLDSSSLQMVKEMASEADATIMIERVGDGEEVSIVIEDGSVKEVRS